MENKNSARCAVFGRCGGCTSQDLPYGQQLVLKHAHLSDLLRNIPCAVAPVIGCADPWRYRNKMEFVFGADKGGQLLLGLHQRSSFGDVVDVDDCWLQSLAGNQVRALTRNFFRARSYAAYNPKTHQGLLRYLVVRQSFSQKKLLANLVLANLDGLAAKDLEAWAAALRTQLPNLASIYISQQAGWGDTAWPDRLKLFWGEAGLTEELDRENGTTLKLRISPLAFFQTNSAQAQRLYQTVADLAALQGPEVVLDLYCGIGGISQWLAPRAGRVYGVESVPSAIADAQSNAQINQVHNVTYIADKVETWLKWNADEVEAAVWILDPPRAGLHPKILNRRLPLLSRRPAKIIYVSCNPKLLPADWQRLQAWYQVRAIVPIDLFPHTPHVEVVVLLSRR